MSQFVKAGTTAELEDLEEGKLVEGGGCKIALFHIGDSYYAIDDTCTHRGGPLSEGMVNNGTVICPWHGACFDIKTGAVLGPPAPVGVKSYPVRVNGPDVEIEIP